MRLMENTPWDVVLLTSGPSRIDNNVQIELSIRLDYLGPTGVVANFVNCESFTTLDPVLQVSDASREDEAR